MTWSQIEKWSGNTWAPALLVGVVAAGVRLWSLETVPYALDEANIIFGVQEVLVGHWPAIGVASSWGLRNPPLLFYLLSLPYALGGPTGIIAALALQNGLAAALVVWLCARELGRGPGMLAGLLFAASPWTIYAARQPWTEVNQLLQTLAIVAATRLMLGGAAWWSAVAIIAVAVNGLGYLLGELLWVSLLFVVLISPRRWLNRWSIAAVGVSFALALPYLAASLFPDVARLPELAMQRGTPFNLAELPMGLHLLKLYLGGANLEALWGARQAELFPLRDLLFSVGDIVLPVFGAGLLVLLWGIHRSGSEIKRAWLGWSIPLLVMLLFQPRPEVLRYETILVPLPFLWLAGLFAAIWDWPRLRQLAQAGGIALSVLWLSGWWLVVIGMSSPSFDSSRTTLASWSLLLRGLPDGGESPVFVSASGNSPEYSSEPGVIRALVERGRTLVFLDGPIGLVRPQPTIYIVTSSVQEPRWGDEPLPGIREVASSPSGRILVVPGIENIELPAGAIALDPPVRYSDGPELRGYLIGGLSGVLELWTVWRMGDVGSRAAIADLTMFNHVIDQNGQRVGQVDGFGLPSSAWQKGQWMVQKYRIAVPATDATRVDGILVGIYDRRDGARGRVISPQGGQRVDGALLQLSRSRRD